MLPQRIIDSMSRRWVPVLFLVGAVLLVNGCSGSPSSVADSGEQARDNADGDGTHTVNKNLQDLEARFSELLQTVELADKEANTLKQTHGQHLATLKQWYENNSATLKEIRGNALKAARDRDMEKFRSMNARGDKETVARLAEEERQLIKEYRNAIFQVIPESQQKVWQAHVISTQLLEFLQPLELTDKEIGQICDLAPTALRQVKGQENWQGYGTTNLEKLFEQRVLPAGRRAEFDELKKKNRLRMLKWNGS